MFGTHVLKLLRPSKLGRASKMVDDDAEDAKDAEDAEDAEDSMLRNCCRHRHCHCGNG